MHPQLRQALIHHIIERGYTYSTEDGNPIRLRPVEVDKLLNEIEDFIRGEGFEIRVSKAYS